MDVLVTSLSHRRRCSHSHDILHFHHGSDTRETLETKEQQNTINTNLQSRRSQSLLWPKTRPDFCLNDPYDMRHTSLRRDVHSICDKFPTINKQPKNAPVRVIGEAQRDNYKRTYVLHGVGHIGRLDQMFNDNSSFSVYRIMGRLQIKLLFLAKGFIPTIVPKFLEMFVHDLENDALAGILSLIHI